MPLGIAWPDDPQWGNFLEAFDQAHMGELMVSSVLIVVGVVPVAVVFATMAGFAIGHLRMRVAGLVRPVPAGPHAAARGDANLPLYYLALSWASTTPSWPYPAPHRALRALRRVLDAGPLPGHAQELSEAARVDGATVNDLFLAHPRASRAAGRVVPRHPVRGLDLEPVPARPGAGQDAHRAHHGRRLGPAFRASTYGHPCSPQARCVILTPTLIVFLLFSSGSSCPALLQGSLKG
ncbi:MAG: hypothetical protein R3C32_01780 [Chloroflexota bacterium]